jgi:hypothetical protein
MMDPELKAEFAALNRRLNEQASNIDLCINFVREMAKAHLTAETIRRIDYRLTSNGHAEDDSNGLPPTNPG